MTDKNPSASGAGAGPGDASSGKISPNNNSRPAQDPANRNNAMKMSSSVELQNQNRSQNTTPLSGKSVPPIAVTAGVGGKLESIDSSQLRAANNQLAGRVGDQGDENSPSGHNHGDSATKDPGHQVSLLEATDAKNQANSEAVRMTCKDRCEKMGCTIKSAYFEYHGKKFEYDIRALFIFPGYFPIRKWLVWLTAWKWFDNFITIVILANSLMLAFTDYEDRLQGTKYYSVRNANIAQVDTAFSILFTFECAAKIISMGFVLHKKSYMRDVWNWLDFFVVMISVIGWIPGIESNSSLKSLRTFRILRPLRSINSMPRMKQLIKTLLASLKGLMNVGLFLAFVFTIFAIFGTHQFNGSQYSRCRMTLEPVQMPDQNDPEMLYWPINWNVPWLCQTDDDCAKWLPEGDIMKCGQLLKEKIPIERDFPETQDLISFDIIGFNDVPQGLFTIFQALTLEGWTGMMYNYMDSNSQPISVFFFCMLVIFGSFFAMQLVLAQIMDSFANQSTEKPEDYQQIEKDERAEDLAKLFVNAAGSKSEIEEAKPEESNDQSDGAKIKPGESMQNKTNASGAKIKGNATMVNTLQRSNEISEDRANAAGGLTNHDISYEPHQDSTRPLGPDFISPRNNSGNRNAICPDPEGVSNSKDSAAKVDASQAEVKESDEDEDNEEYEDEDDNDIAARLRSKKFCLYRAFYLMVTHPVYNFIVFMLILVNTVILAIDDFPQSIQKEDYLTIFNDFFTWAFFAEMLMKMFGLGVKNYVRDNFNLFDAIVVLLSLVDVTISSVLTPEQIGSMSQAFQALRALRLLRVIKLARSWTKLQDILSKTVKSFKDISNFSVLLGLFMYIMALLGMEMFANRVRYTLDDNVVKNVTENFNKQMIMVTPRMNFDNIGNALTTIFCEIMGEDWNVYMYTYVRPQEGLIMPYVVQAYFLSLMIMGNIMLLSLFTAILLQNFEDTDEDEEEEGGDKEKFSIKSIFTRAFLLSVKDVFLGIFGAKKRKSKPADVLPKENAAGTEMVAASPQSGVDKPSGPGGNNTGKTANKLPQIQEENGEEEGEIGNVILGKQVEVNQSSQQLLPGSLGNGSSANLNQSEKIATQKKNLSKSMTLMHYTTESKKDSKKNDYIDGLKEKLQGQCLFIFGPENRIRIFAHMICSHPYFDRFILVLICISTMTLAFETPLDNPKGIKVTILTYIDYVMSSFFYCECLTKVLANGFAFCGPNSYIRNPWNILDFTIVMSALISMIFVNVDLKAIKSLRILRVLRPLRIVAKNRGLKLAITSLFNSLPNIANLLLIVVFFIFLLSILCMTLFSGQFFQCSTDHLNLSYYQQNDLINTMSDCLNYGGEWINPDFHFDTTSDAMVTLLSIQTTEGWIDVMWNMVDSVGQYQQPNTYNNMIYIIFCMAIMIFITLLFLNLFVGVVIETFNKEKEALSLNSLLRQIERKWIDVQIMTYQAKPVVKTNLSGQKCRDVMIKIVLHPVFDQFIMGMILANTLVLAIRWYAMPDWVQDTTVFLNYFFSVVFTIEAIIKLIAMRCNYFKDAWNKFDFIVVIGTWVVILVLNLKLDLDLEILGTVLRTLRIGRVFRIVKRAPAIQIIFQTLMEALPAIASLGLLLGLLFFMYSVIGIGQFGAITLQENLNFHTNFQGIFEAFLLLMRCATGEGWNSVMMDAARPYQILFQCNENSDYYSIRANGGQTDGCGNPVAIAYFYSFTLIVSQIFLNLFIAIIIDSFLNNSDAMSLPVTQNDVDEFIECWQEYDPDALGYIESKNIDQFIQDLSQKECGLIPNRKLVAKDVVIRRRFIASLEIPAFNTFKRFMFYDVLQTMARKVCEKCYNKDRLRTKKSALAKIRLMTHMEDHEIDQHIKAIFGVEYELDFEEIVQNIGDLNKNIDSVSVLTGIAQNIGKASRKKGHSLDKNEDAEDDIYTSKHFVYGKLIVECWREFLKAKEAESSGLQGDNNNNTSALAGQS